MLSRLVQLALVVALALTIGNHANGAPLTYGTYYEDKGVPTQCTNSLTCRLNFSQLPSDKLLMVEKVNCYIQSVSPITFLNLSISATLGGSPLGRYLQLAVPAPQIIASSNNTTLQADIRFLVGNGRFPYLLVQTVPAGNSYMDCTITGVLVTPL